MSLATRDDSTVLLHFNEATMDTIIAGGDSSDPSNPTHSREAIFSYIAWLAQTADAVIILVPDRYVAAWKQNFAHIVMAKVVSLGQVGVAFDDMHSPERVWVLNGSHLPTLEWDFARGMSRPVDQDLVVFAKPVLFSDTHYPESVLVDQSGCVVRFERHYFDSPQFSFESESAPSFLLTSGRYLAEVVSHLGQSGWQPESFATLASCLRIKWDQSASTRWSGTSSTNTPRTQNAPGFFGRLKSFGSKDELGSSGASDSRNNDGLRFQDYSSYQHYTSTLAQSGERNSISEEFPAPAANDAYRAMKRLMDVSISAIALVLLSPLFILVAILVKITSRGPVVFGHKRQGLAGREFKCWKFRSMVQDAAEQQDALRNENEVDGPQFKIMRDPRLTSLGRWLRRYNIDELPQLFNVLVGEMSLVGPRPSPDNENQLCPAWRRTRLSVKPGITGLWQVLRMRDPSSSDFQEWIYYDVEYARHRSLWLDWQLLVYTPLAMFTPSGASWLARRLHRRGICVDSAHARR